jgi:hypothetical protein
VIFCFIDNNFFVYISCVVAGFSAVCFKLSIEYLFLRLLIHFLTYRGSLLCKEGFQSCKTPRDRCPKSAGD